MPNEYLLTGPQRSKPVEFSDFRENVLRSKPMATDHYIRVLWDYKQLAESRRSRQVAERIISALETAGHCRAIEYVEWKDDIICCQTSRGIKVAIPCRYDSGVYHVKSIVKQRKRFSPFAWLLNGQASTGAEQVALFLDGEFSVAFEDFQRIMKAWLDAIA